MERKWKNNIDKYSSKEDAKILMKTQNPIVIPRNNLIEESIKEADNENLKPFFKTYGCFKKSIYRKI